MIKKAILLAFIVGLFSDPTYSQSYFNEFGKRIIKAEYEDKILNGPYFGVPGTSQGDMKLVHRMPVGVTDARIFYEKLGLMEDFRAGKPLIVIYYPGKDECNSTGLSNNPQGFLARKKAILKYAEKNQAAQPKFIYGNPHGLEKYQGIIEWIPDPEGIFQQYFFQFPYPCGSFVVIHPKGNYRAILGEYPVSQIDVALKKL
jgi:hypothetical protein